MADSKVPALTALSAPAVGDLLYIVDVSDTTDDATGSSRKITLTTLGNLIAPVRILCRPLGNEPPASAYATLDFRNAHPVLDFDGATDEEAVWTRILPSTYRGGGLTIKTYWSLTSATSGTFVVQAAIERIDLSSLDTDADSFAAFQSSGAVTAPGTSGHVVLASIALTDGAQMDSLAAGELFRLKIRRDADGTSGTDDITTDAELRLALITETGT